uniref:Uncharacterized protein n=1 Tax=Anopheles atroparvus TaxID=41427 RepID=A0A182J6I7_ANOAO
MGVLLSVPLHPRMFTGILVPASAHSLVTETVPRLPAKSISALGAQQALRYPNSVRVDSKEISRSKALFNDHSMREEDLILARAIVQQQQDASPGASPAPLRRTLVTNLQDKTKQFR